MSKRIQTTYHILVKDDGTKRGEYAFGYLSVVERVLYDDQDGASILDGYPPVYQSYGEARLIEAGYRLREPTNKRERAAVDAHRSHAEAMDDRWSLRRSVKRDGTSVTWQNSIAGRSGQGATEVFTTEAEAIERARQAEACEPLPIDREPVATTREAWG